jgi:hypothetical protein
MSQNTRMWQPSKARFRLMMAIIAITALAPHTLENCKFAGRYGDFFCTPVRAIGMGVPTFYAEALHSTARHFHLGFFLLNGAVAYFLSCVLLQLWSVKNNLGKPTPKKKKKKLKK